ncbi:tRNA (adenosine(37)-N6)-threonylcarbamoyltransferase complex ATPase subunit type 1 TsaE [Loktanella sp. D2R18]|uniref:tRNA (adenosine(37)-N6)-threonylcarbamoyltransferase complex ATPase subunit type 1 TsaE n=1 Tax=Rhodobacterales TaxID=204455 RepID=UPI000DEAE30D|nr:MULTISPECIES: tRNA (adenosine(37)-N6)-threonylcarbamoyltransferase complex ATPase subunit type 1 TsaE [Rhodobacterales]MDO6590482.1 tRNA (adenosine(37)-N6)-threonylcarbamoyltransferase complex ATPase subunit type 1 TsaE [Yoonia sp. 1_MG-2023]RBW41201.1 tRNA (adenosine(37)-N6)-threonylcarbamoyltransferase complex ATPase subunit type 1 TsaE [Loktanella sp. D2R18]
MTTIGLPTETATVKLAQRIAGILSPGDTLLLSGEIGAGKSAFSRALIRARLGRMEDVPSPTFTLVQTYDDPSGDIWHCDLYRLTHPDEIFELGLDEAFTTAICLIEWPDRLGPDAPNTALQMKFHAGDTAHSVEITTTPAWADRLEGVL